MANILVVDDEKQIRAVIVAYLKEEGHRVLEAENGMEALQTLEDHKVDLMILDRMMPMVSGEQVLKTLRDKDDSLPVILLTAKVTESDRVEGLDLGADDYVTKPFGNRELMARVRALLRRSGGTERAHLVHGSLSLTVETMACQVAGQEVKLTAKEFQLLHLLVLHPKRVFSRRELLERVFDEEAGVYDRTIDVHVKNIRKKLGSAGKLIQTVYGVGYRMGGE